MAARLIGDELLEPFRPRKSSRSLDDITANLNDFVSKLTTFQVTSGQSEEQQAQDHEDALLDNEAALMKANADMAEINEFQQSVVTLTQDDEVFRKVKADMRASARTGFGSQHVIHSYIEQARTKEVAQRRKVSSCRSISQDTDMKGQVNLQSGSTVPDMRRQFTEQKTADLPLVQKSLIRSFTRGFQRTRQPKRSSLVPACA